MQDLPHFYQCKQFFLRESIKNLPLEIEKAITECLQRVNLKPGSKIAITAGSRGIHNIVEILRLTVQQFKERGYAPFLISAMGSHGRGEAKGQEEILHSLGITERTIGAPLSCSGEVTQIGVTPDRIETEIGVLKGIGGLPVYFATEALQADGLFVVNRIKPHTSFHGDYESGLLKMLAVGLGRAKGANSVHSLGVEQLAMAIPSIAKIVLDRVPVLGGIGIVENAYEEAAIIKGIPSERIFAEEKELLKKAKQMMPKLPVDSVDLCLIGEMGKNYSGTGMDTNIIGRLRIQGMPEPDNPHIKYLAVLGLSKESHGNATGIGLADFTTKAVVDQIDKEATYLNCLTSGFVMRSAIPMTFSDEKELLKNAIYALKVNDLKRIRLLYIKNTLNIDEFWVSETVYQELKGKENIKLVNGPLSLEFDSCNKIFFK